MTIEERAERQRQREQEPPSPRPTLSLDGLELGRLKGQGGAFKLSLLGATIAFAGCFGPWSGDGSFYGDQLMGFATDEGKIFLFGLGTMAYCLWRYAEDYRPIRVVVSLIAALVVLLGSIDLIVTFESIPEELFAQDHEGPPDEVQTSWGLWLVTLGSGLLTISLARLALREAKGG